MRKISGACLGAVLVAGTAVALAAPAQAGVAGAAPAQAAPPTKQCALGSWRLVSENRKSHGVYKRVKWTQRVTGAAGVKLTVGKSKAGYDFKGSKKEFMTGRYGRTRMGSWTLTRGKLQLNIKLVGDRKGTYTTNGKTATGNATGRGVVTAPRRRVIGKYSLVRNLRKREGDTLIPRKATFTCTPRQLVLTVKDVGRNRDSSWYILNTLTYRRI